jgi:hypothetical protein
MVDLLLYLRKTFNVIRLFSSAYPVDPDPKGRNWRYWSPSTNFFLFGALLSHCNISLYWSIELLRLRIGVQGLLLWKTTEHYILHCHIYDHERAKLAVQLKTIDEILDLSTFPLIKTSTCGTNAAPCLWMHDAQHKIRILILKVAIDATGPRVLIFFSLVLYCLAKLAVQLKTIDEILDLLHLLTRDSNKEKHQNKLTFLEEFIKSTGLFPELASPVPRSWA